MMPSRVWSLAIGLAVATAGRSANSQMTGNDPPDTGRTPRLINTCVITNHVKQLVDFYESILVLKAKWSGEDYAEFPTGVGVLAIFSAESQEKYIPGSG